MKKENIPKGVYAITESAELLGVNRERVRKSLRNADIKPYCKIGRAEYYWLKDVFVSLVDRNELDLQQERARLAKKQTEKIQLQIDETNSKLIPAEEVQEEWIKYITACRAKLLALPTKMTSSVAAADSPQEIHQLLKKEIYEALTELANS